VGGEETAGAGLVEGREPGEEGARIWCRHAAQGFTLLLFPERGPVPYCSFAAAAIVAIMMYRRIGGFVKRRNPYRS
jgi:hypothetical protein